MPLRKAASEEIPGRVFPGAPAVFTAGIPASSPPAPSRAVPVTAGKERCRHEEETGLVGGGPGTGRRGDAALRRPGVRAGRRGPWLRHQPVAPPRRCDARLTSGSHHVMFVVTNGSG